MNSVRAAGVGVVLMSCTLGAASVHADAFDWTPGWSEGTYWVVRTPRFVDSCDWVTGVANDPRQDGHYLTRFTVAELAPSPSGGGSARLEVRFSVEGETDYLDTADWFELELRLSDLSPIRVAWHGVRADGGPIEEVVRFSSEAGGKEPFIWPDVLPLPRGLGVGLPVLEPGAAPGSYLMKSRSGADEPPSATQAEFSQTVTFHGTGRGWSVSIGHGDGSQAALELTLADASTPWPSVSKRGILSTVVELGPPP